MMRYSRVLFSILITLFGFAYSKKVLQPTVEYYENWKRRQEAAEYVFPRDARMHEAKDTVVRGKVNIKLCINLYS